MCSHRNQPIYSLNLCKKCYLRHYYYNKQKPKRKSVSSEKQSDEKGKDWEVWVGSKKTELLFQNPDRSVQCWIVIPIILKKGFVNLNKYSNGIRDFQITFCARKPKLINLVITPNTLIGHFNETQALRGSATGIYHHKKKPKLLLFLHYFLGL